MNPVTMIARTNPRTTSWFPSGRSTGAKLDSLDIAYACRNLGRMEYLAVRLLWAGDLSAGDEITKGILKVLKAVNKREKWGAGQDRLKKMAELAVSEHAYPDKIKYHKQKHEIIGISESSYYKNWRSRYDLGYDYISMLANSAWHKINRDQ